MGIFTFSTINSTRNISTTTTTTLTMKTFTFAALFVLACLLVASALADSGDNERRPGGFGPGRPNGGSGGPNGGSSGGPNGGSSGGPNGGSTLEDEDIATLFSSINGQNGILNEQTFSGLSAATQGQNGLEKLPINLSIKVVLVKIGDKYYKAY